MRSTSTKREEPLVARMICALCSLDKPYLRMYKCPSTLWGKLESASAYQVLKFPAYVAFSEVQVHDLPQMCHVNVSHDDVSYQFSILQLMLMLLTWRHLHQHYLLEQLQGQAVVYLMVRLVLQQLLQ